MAKTKTRHETPAAPSQDVVPEFPFDVADVAEFEEKSPLEQMLASPTIEPPAEASAAKKPADEKDIAPEAAAPPSILVELPIGEPAPESYHFRHLNLHLDAEQAETLRRYYEGCVGKRFASGRAVTSAADVVRYWLDETRRQNPQA